MNLPGPFVYPVKPHVRRHGPRGYSQYRQYRNWLRDEFSFRCIYCLRRETWLTLKKDYEIDHFFPKSKHFSVQRDYDNLVYACSQCNGTKATNYLPSPETVAYGSCLSVDENGEIHPLNGDGITIIEALYLDGIRYTEMRRRILDTISEAPLGGKTLQWCLGFPDPLPNLSDETEPKENTRPAGIWDSHYERNRRGELPKYY